MFVLVCFARKNFGNVYIWGCPFVISNTDAQNGLDSYLNAKIRISVKNDLLKVILTNIRQSPLSCSSIEKLGPSR